MALSWKTNFDSRHILRIFSLKRVSASSECVCGWRLFGDREARLRSVFRDFDKDGSGLIDRAELDAVFNELGQDFSDDELQRMIQLADKDESGTLNYEEFISYVFGE